MNIIHLHYRVCTLAKHFKAQTTHVFTLQIHTDTLCNTHTHKLHTRNVRVLTELYTITHLYMIRGQVGQTRIVFGREYKRQANEKNHLHDI